MQVMNKIIHTATMASPSAVNQQAYRFYVVYNKAVLHSIADKALAALMKQGFDIPACLCFRFLRLSLVSLASTEDLWCTQTVQQFVDTKKLDVIFYDPQVVVFITLPSLSLLNAKKPTKAQPERQCTQQKQSARAPST